MIWWIFGGVMLLLWLIAFIGILTEEWHVDYHEIDGNLPNGTRRRVYPLRDKGGSDDG